MSSHSNRKRKLASPFKQSILISSHNQIQFHATMDINRLTNKTDARVTVKRDSYSLSHESP